MYSVYGGGGGNFRLLALLPRVTTVILILWHLFYFHYEFVKYFRIKSL
jgi:hypothetical protein